MQQKYIYEYKCDMHGHGNEHRDLLCLHAQAVVQYVYMCRHTITTNTTHKYYIQYVVFLKIQTHTVSLTNTQMHQPPPSARPISQIHNWPSIMPEFICMVPAEVFTRCLWVSLTWLGCRSTNLLGWSSGYSSIIRWIQEILWNWWFSVENLMFVIGMV